MQERLNLFTYPINGRQNTDLTSAHIENIKCYFFCSKSFKNAIRESLSIKLFIYFTASSF